MEDNATGLWLVVAILALLLLLSVLPPTTETQAPYQPVPAYSVGRHVYPKTPCPPNDRIDPKTGLKRGGHCVSGGPNDTGGKWESPQRSQPLDLGPGAERGMVK